VLIWSIELEFGFDTLSFWMDHLRMVDLLCCVPELYMLKMYLFAQYSIFLNYICCALLHVPLLSISVILTSQEYVELRSGYNAIFWCPFAQWLHKHVPIVLCIWFKLDSEHLILGYL
jgi:hypothetical protein